MPWSERSTMSLRREFAELASLDGANMQGLCERYGISRPTGYKWLRRYQSEGAAGLTDHSRRPRVSPWRTAESVERALLSVRGAHPNWCARKLRKVLLREPLTEAATEPVIEAARAAVPKELVPAASTITEILRRNGRLDPEECASRQPFHRFEHPHPNAMWQMDFKGHFGLLSGQRCHPLTALDDHSRFCLLLGACSDERANTVQKQLTGCFREHGMPEKILCDNGPPWGGAGTRSCHTAFSAWLIRLGVLVYHGRPWHPQTQGKDERFHRTLLDELVRPVMGLSVRWNKGAASANKPGASASQSGKVVQVADHAACQEHFDSWRRVYNEIRPHEAIDLEVPARRYQPSQRLFPEQMEPIVYDSLPGQIVRKVHPSGEISFRNRRVFVGSAFAGEPVAIRNTDEDGLLNVFYCRQRIAFIDLRMPDQ
jgi:transposase InsO family protein